MLPSRDRGSGLGKGAICGDGGESGESRAEKPPDSAASEDLGIKAGLASYIADDLLRTGRLDACTDAGGSTVDGIPLVSVGGATNGVAGTCCLLLSTGRDKLAADVVSGCAMTPSSGDIFEDGELECPRKVAVGA